MISAGGALALEWFAPAPPSKKATVFQGEPRQAGPAQTEGPSPATGLVLAGTFRKLGLSTFSVDNGSLFDAVVSLARDGKSYVAFYVRAGDHYKLQNVAPGTYDIFVRSGEGWIPAAKHFARREILSKFDQPCKVQETPGEAGTTKYSNISATLHPVIGGNATTSFVDEKDFPSLAGG